MHIHSIAKTTFRLLRKRRFFSAAFVATASYLPAAIVSAVSAWFIWLSYWYFRALTYKVRLGK